MIKCQKCENEIDNFHVCCYCRKIYCLKHINFVKHDCSKYYLFSTPIVKSKSRIIQRKSVLFLIFFIGLFIKNYYLSSITPILRDPTYDELVKFIKEDTINENEYNNTYTCLQFSLDLNKNAHNLGIRSGFVLIFFDNCSHLLNCFNTTDEGIIYVEPQTDAIVTLNIGEKYWNRERKLNIEYDDTISSILITWEEKEIRSYTALKIID